MRDAQLEFANLPPRKDAIPVETSTEMERVFLQIFKPLRDEERVVLCQEILTFPGEMAIAPEPLQLVDRSKRTLNARPITLGRPFVIRAALRALQTTAKGVAA
jgi:hypothetical protein